MKYKNILFGLIAALVPLAFMAYNGLTITDQAAALNRILYQGWGKPYYVGGNFIVHYGASGEVLSKYRSSDLALNLTSPAGNETFEVGSSQTIKWQITGQFDGQTARPNKVTIRLVAIPTGALARQIGGRGRAVVIAGNIPSGNDGGSFTWSVGSLNQQIKNHQFGPDWVYRIEISAGRSAFNVGLPFLIQFTGSSKPFRIQS